MANLNKVMLIGRLTRDPELRSFQNGGRVASFGFAVNNSKKNKSTGEWENEPVFIDCDAFNREKGQKLADLVEQYLGKGKQCYIEGRLKLDQWQDKQTGDKRSKLKLIVDQVQFLEPKSEGGGNGKPKSGGGGGYNDYSDDSGSSDSSGDSGGGGDDGGDIPF